LAQASIGPGMGIFTRYAKVLEADDSSMTVRTALQLINAALDDYLSEQESEHDAETRYAITWFETHGTEQGAYGEAETLAKARKVSVSGVRDSGLIESKAGKVRLRKRAELPTGWQPTDDKTPTVWECTQHLIRVLEADCEAAAAALLAKLGPRADPTRDLAYRLYQVCERQKWAEEARAYNGRVVAWPELQKLASAHAAPAVREEAQGALV
jgi:putative DNA methylase